MAKGNLPATAVDGETAAWLSWFPDLLGNPDPGAERAFLLSGRLQGGKQPVHVLMIEDDAAIAEMYRVQLEHDGYRVTIVGTAEAGFTTLTMESPDVVLLDLLLPDTSGFEVLATLKSRFPNHPPVVILTNYGEPTMIDRGLALGAIEYLVKSRVTPAQVSKSIPGWLVKGGGGEKTDS